MFASTVVHHSVECAGTDVSWVMYGGRCVERSMVEKGNLQLPLLNLWRVIPRQPGLSPFNWGLNITSFVDKMVGIRVIGGFLCRTVRLSVGWMSEQVRITIPNISRRPCPAKLDSRMPPTHITPTPIDICNRTKITGSDSHSLRLRLPSGYLN